MCNCKSKSAHLYEFMHEYCVDCGRVFVLESCGNVRPTEQFHKTSKPLGGTWIGHTFIKGVCLIR